jgi:hypothetical protein
MLRAGGAEVPELFLSSVKGDAGTRKQLDLLLVGSRAHPNLPPTSRRKVKN